MEGAFNLWIPIGGRRNGFATTSYSQPRFLKI